MPSRVLISALGLGMLVIGESACGGGPQTPPPPPPPKSTVPTPTGLRTLYRIISGTDRRTTVGSGERTSFPLESQTYYVPDQAGNSRETLNRVVNSSGTDYADAISDLSGYSQDMELGFPWNNGNTAGAAQLEEAFNSLTGDHALLAPSENLLGYVRQPLAAYGYPRYGNAAEVLLSLSAGGVTVQSNAVAGGSTWRWFWNGVEFLNHNDYGREIQSAFYFDGPQLINPNEAGDRLTFNFLDQSVKHGSPILKFENQGNTQVTRAIPLNWDPAQFSGDQDHPVIWDGLVIGKDLTLNFDNLGPVARYTTHLILPDAAKGGMETPSIWLRSSFNRFWTYDASTKTLVEVTSSVGDGCSKGNPYFFHASFGGTIASDASGSNAIGVYAVSVASGGSISYISIGRFICWGDGPDESGSDTLVMDAIKGGGDGVSANVVFPAGESTQNVYIITDSVQNVTARMDDLFAAGVR
jgi:hypothetical protein